MPLRQDAVELAARGDVELGEDLAQVVLDGTGADEQAAPISGFVSPLRASVAT